MDGRIQSFDGDCEIGIEGVAGDTGQLAGLARIRFDGVCERAAIQYVQHQLAGLVEGMYKDQSGQGESLDKGCVTRCTYQSLAMNEY